MNRHAWRGLLTLTLLTGLFVTQIDAFCSKCVKIEAEREKEKTEHPQTWDYYDEAKQKVKEEQKPQENEKSETPLIFANNTNDHKIQKIVFFEEDDIFPGSHSEEADSTKMPQSRNINGQTSPPETTSDPSLSSSYSTLFTIFRTKNFIHTLNGSFTLFAPTNEALNKLPPGTLQALSRQENAEKLASLVSNHVVARKLLKKDFIHHHNFEIKAISGKNLTLTFQNGQLYIDDIKILRAEPIGDDGIIYIIERVILP